MTQPHIDNNPSTQVKQTAAQGTQSSTNATNPGGGWRQMKSTTAFRALNFELYVKPNKVIMTIGLAALTGCVCALAYMNVRQEQRKEYTVIQQDGSLGSHKRASRWE